MEYSIRIYKVEKEDSNLRGFVSITFDHVFCAKSIALKESQKGSFYLEMPKYKEYGTEEYVPFFAFKDQKFRKAVTEQVKEAYQKMEDKMVDLKETWGDEELYYDLSVLPTKGNDTFKGEVSMKLQDVFVIHQMHIIQGWNGKTVVGMPQRENSYKNEREDIAHPIEADFKQELEAAIMEEYQRKQEFSQNQRQHRAAR